MMVGWYLIQGLAMNLLVFIKRWYLDSWYRIFGAGRYLVRRLERSLAIRIHIRFFFVPLYQERNIYGYVLGFLFRSLKIVGGGALYVCIGALVLLVYVAWALLPFLLIRYAMGYAF